MLSKNIIKKRLYMSSMLRKVFVCLLLTSVIFSLTGLQNNLFAVGDEYLRIRSGDGASEEYRYLEPQQPYVPSRPSSNVIGDVPDNRSAVSKSTYPLTFAEQGAPVNEYIIALGDLLEVFVWQNPDLSKDVLVGPDGKISYPLVGRIKVVGLTLKEFEDRLVLELSKYVKSPQVSVMIKAFSETPPNRVIVLGAVAAPGVYSYRGTINLLEAIAQAGDFRDDAKDDTVIIVRGNLSKNPKVIKVNARSIIRRGTTRNEIVLKPRDVIFVPRSTVRKTKAKIMILGEVAYPGIYTYAKNLTLLEAVSLAGDFKESARSDSVMLMRGKVNEKPELTRINVRRMVLKAELQNNIVLRPDDVIYVPRSFINDFNKFFENIKNVVDNALYILDVRQEIRMLQGHIR